MNEILATAITTIPHHNRPDGQWCRWSASHTRMPYGLCPDRCLPIGILTAHPDPNAIQATCHASVRCSDRAVGWYPNPILGTVPYCGRCAQVLGAELTYLCSECQELFMPLKGAAQTFLCGNGTFPLCPACIGNHVCTGCDREAVRTADPTD